jgi:hypothetical protein
MIGGVNIPKELFLEIKAFLTEYEYWKLLITADHAFAELRFSTRMIYLEYGHWKSVLETTDELQAASSKVQCTKSQLYLKRGCLEGQYDCSVFEFDCFYADDCNPAQLSAFLTTRFDLMVKIQPSSQSFELAVRRESLKISNSHDKMQFNSLKNLKRLKLHDCAVISEVHLLKNLESLEISCCDAITDVSELGKVHELYISSCQGIKDISRLTNNYSLRVEACANLQILPKTVECVIFASTFDISGIKFPRLRRIHFMRNSIDDVFIMKEKGNLFQKLFQVKISHCDNLLSLL